MFDIEHKPNYTISFYKNEKQIGALDFNGPTMTFEGDAEESAKVFFDFVAKSFAGRLEQERKREWVGMTFDEFAKLMPYCHNEFDLQDFQTFAAAIEAKLKEKNT
jgi:hypothetical protein